ncbi:hypothetical protein B0H13DRAFT_2460520 [Mycena leptocephala]|nr:hypothetical protein B0H13DRAFT_2460520 [Mycena leptocephala]
MAGLPASLQSDILCSFFRAKVSPPTARTSVLTQEMLKFNRDHTWFDQEFRPPMFRRDRPSDWLPSHAIPVVVGGGLNLKRRVDDEPEDEKPKPAKLTKTAYSEDVRSNGRHKHTSSAAFRKRSLKSRQANPSLRTGILWARQDGQAERLQGNKDRNLHAPDDLNGAHGCLFNRKQYWTIQKARLRFQRQPDEADTETRQQGLKNLKGAAQ